VAKLRVRLRELIDERAAQGEPPLTQAEIASGSGISQSTISRWIRDKVDRSDFETIEKLCVFLKCEPGDLLTMDWDAEPSSP
jgi:putative transcriptional regulator